MAENAIGSVWGGLLAQVRVSWRRVSVGSMTASKGVGHSASFRPLLVQPSIHPPMLNF